MKAVIMAGKDVVDISFFIEDPMALDELAKQKPELVVVDSGYDEDKMQAQVLVDVVPKQWEAKVRQAAEECAPQAIVVTE